LPIHGRCDVAGGTYFLTPITHRRCDPLADTLARSLLCKSIRRAMAMDDSQTAILRDTSFA